MEFSLRKANKVIRKLDLHNGSIILIKTDSGLDEMSVLDQLGKAIGGTALKDILLVVVDDFDDITVVDEEAMNRSGWFHIDALSNMIHQGEVSEADWKDKPQDVREETTEETRNETTEAEEEKENE